MIVGWEGPEMGAATAYRQIKERIVNLEYQPGEKLSEARLAAELGFGRSPIRSAVARLKSEGWIEVSPQSGSFVRALTDHEIGDMTTLRVMLETHCARIGAGRMNEAEIAKLRSAFATLGPLAASGDGEAFIEVDTRLHLALYRSTDNQMIAGILLDLRDKVQWVRRACAVSSERVREGFGELKPILRALIQRDPEAAAERMRIHIENSAAFCRMVDRAASRSRSRPASRRAPIQARAVE